MEKKNKNKSIILLPLIIIIVGLIVISSKGFKFDLNYEATKQVEIYVGKEFEISDIKEITNQVFEKQDVLIQKVEVYEDMVSIKALDITEEQKNTLIEKINEKYEGEIKAEDVEIKAIPHTRARDILKPYVVPFAVTTVITLIYMAVRFKKLKMSNIILKTILTIVISQLLLFSIIAIARIPVGQITIPMILFVYVITILILTTKLEKELKNIIIKEEK